jgi:outer membrane protein
MKTATFSLAIAALLCSLSGPAHAGDAARIGYVDLQRAVNETEDGKKASAEIKADTDAKVKVLEQHDEAIKKAEAAKEKPEALQARRLKAAQLRQQYVEQIGQRERESTAKIAERLIRVLNSIGTARKLSIVQAPAMLYRGPGVVDITDEAIKRYNAGEGRETAEELARARAEVAALKAENEKLKTASPVKPSVASKQ